MDPEGHPGFTGERSVATCCERRGDRRGDKRYRRPSPRTYVALPPLPELLEPVERLENRPVGPTVERMSGRMQVSRRVLFQDSELELAFFWLCGHGVS